MAATTTEWMSLNAWFRKRTDARFSRLHAGFGVRPKRSEPSLFVLMLSNRPTPRGAKRKSEAGVLSLLPGNRFRNTNVLVSDQGTVSCTFDLRVPRIKLKGSLDETGLRQVSKSLVPNNLYWYSISGSKLP
jgi:hypothetical protein